MKFKDFLMMLFEADETAGTETTNEGAQDANQEGNQSDEKTYTDADVDRIINKKFAEWQKKQEKAVAEAQKLANMNAQERAEAERDAWEKKYNELLAKNTRAELTVQARSMLSNESITGISDELVAMMVTDNAETTQANVKAFTKMFKEAVQAEVKNLNKKPSPRVGGSSQLTKEDIMKVQDVNERQKLIRENMDLFR